MEKPAILGGPAAVQWDDRQFESSQRWPILGPEELDSIQRIFDDGDISTHPLIRDLETAYCQRTGRQYGLAHNNGTAALMAAFFALGLEPGDQILVPTATFWASALPMMWHGLVPVFCESEPRTLGLDIRDVQAKMSPRVRAMVIVPLLGIPSEYQPLLEFARTHRLKVIEDASHAHGAVYKGQPVGSFGDISVFSLQGDKLAPAGEGGILLTDDYQYWEKAVCLGDITRIIELQTPARRFAATSFGLKTRIAPVSAAIALAQLRKLDHHNQIRKENLTRLSLALETFGFTTYRDQADWQRTYFEFLVHVPHHGLNREQWLRALRAEGCRVMPPRYPLLHEQPFFTEGHFRQILRIDDSLVPEYPPGGFEQTRQHSGQMIKFPTFPHKADGLLEQYIKAVHKVGRQWEQILEALG